MAAASGREGLAVVNPDYGGLADDVNTLLALAGRCDAAAMRMKPQGQGATGYVAQLNTSRKEMDMVSELVSGKVPSFC
jgi:hypothetical protein